MSTEQIHTFASQPIDVPSRDKQVVHVCAARFSAWVDAGIDTRELDRTLTLLGIELVIDGAEGVVPAAQEPVPTGPGMVGTATVLGVPGVRVMLTQDGDETTWIPERDINGVWRLAPSDITDFVLLPSAAGVVVADPDPEDVTS